MDETFILVSHDMDFVRDTCHRLTMMRGEIISTGTTAEIPAQDSVEEKADRGQGNPFIPSSTETLEYYDN